MATTSIWCRLPYIFTVPSVFAISEVHVALLNILLGRVSGSVWIFGACLVAFSRKHLGSVIVRQPFIQLLDVQRYDGKVA